MTLTLLPHDLHIHVPPYFLCPISLELMKDPVTLSSGQTFDRSSIQPWLDDGHSSCPVTRHPIDPDLEDPIPNHALRRMIQSWCVQNKSLGVERILTPRLPPSLKDIPTLLDRIHNDTSSPAAAAGDMDSALHQLCKLASDRPKARQLLLHHGAVGTLTLFLSQSLSVQRRKLPNSGKNPNSESKFTSDVLDALLLLADLLEESSQFSWEFRAMEEVLLLVEIISDAEASLELRRNAAIVISRAWDMSDSLKRTVGATAGFMDGIVGLIRAVPAPDSAALSPRVGTYDYIKAGLMLTMTICEGSTRNRVLATGAGVVEAMASLLGGICQDLYEHGADNLPTVRIIEMGLKVWESVCKCADGRSATWPFQGLVVSHMACISDKATKYSMHILWLLLKWAPAGSNVARRAAEQGAFLKAMAITQSNASVRTRALARKMANALTAFVVIHSQVYLQ